MAAPIAPQLVDERLIEALALLRALSAKVDSLQGTLSGQRKALLTVGEFAELVGRSAYTARRWIAEGRVHATRVDGTGPRGRLLIPHSEIERVIAMGIGEEVPAAIGQ